MRDSRRQSRRWNSRSGHPVDKRIADLGLYCDLVASWMPDRGITLGGTLLGTGASPPAVSLTATPSTSKGCWVDIVDAGILGASTVRCSTDDGTTYTDPVATAESVDFGNGFVCGFASGTYSADNLYYATVSAYSDLSGMYSLTQGTAGKQLVYSSVGWDGHPSLVGNATRQTFMLCTDNGVCVPFNGEDANCAMLFAHDSNQANAMPGGLFGATSTTGRASPYLANTTGNDTYYRGASSYIAATSAGSGRRHMLVRNVGTAGEIFRNGISVKSGTIDAGSMTMTRLALGAFAAENSTLYYLTGNQGLVVLARTVSDPAGLTQYLASLGWNYA